MKKIIILIGFLFPVVGFSQVKVAEPKFRFEQNRLSYVVTVENVSGARVKGGVCVRFFDADGFEIQHDSSGEINFSPKAIENANGYALIEPKLEREIANVKLYFAKYRCADSPSEAISNVVSIKYGSPKSDGSTGSSSPNKNSVKKYKTGLEYSWWPANDNASCKPSEKNICLNQQEYMEMCKVAEGISKGGIEWRATFGSGEEKRLLEGGQYDDIRVVWAQSMAGKEQCYGVVTASGIVNGNSMRKEIQGVVKKFVVDDMGKVLVHSFDLW